MNPTRLRLVIGGDATGQRDPRAQWLWRVADAATILVTMRSVLARAVALAQTHPSACLALVAAVFFVAQVVLFDVGRHWEWDEAVYVSQVSPSSDALHFAVTRARGITLVAAPAVLASDSIVVLRWFLAALSSVCLFLAYSVWIRVDRVVALLGAALFGLTWTALFYGSEVSPNLYSALGLVGVAGLVARGTQERSRAAVITGIVALTAATGVMRPYDMSIGVVGIAGAVAVWAARSHGVGSAGRRAALPMLAALAIGAVIGWMPWLVENSLRLGGPVEALRSAVGNPDVGTAGWGNHLLSHLAATDGPIFSTGQGAIPLGGLVWWTVWGLLALGGLFWRPRGAGTGSSTAVYGGLTAFAGYLFIAPFAPRFLTPAYALLAVGVAGGLIEVTRRIRRWSTVVWLLVVVIASWQVSTALAVAAAEDVRRDRNRALAEALESVTGDPPCAFWSQVSYPQLQVETGCVGRSLDIRARTPDQDMVAAQERLGAVYFVITRSPPRTSFLAELPSVEVESPPDETWLIVVLDG